MLATPPGPQPVTPGAAQSQFGGGSDAFVAKYSPAGALLWATYYGGSGADGARAIAVDPSGNVLVTGITSSLDLPVVNALSSHLDGEQLFMGVDAFVVKLDTDGRATIHLDIPDYNGRPQYVLDDRQPVTELL